MLSLMLPGVILWVGLLLANRPVIAQNSTAGLKFGPVSFEGYENYVYRDNITSVQLVVSGGSSNTAPSRFITAFPRGNTGTVVYFVPVAGANGTNSSTPLGTSLNLTSVQSYQSDFNQTGIQGSLSVSADLRFGVTLSVRTVRDYTESGGTVFRSIFNYTLGPSNSSSVTLVRRWVNGTTVQYLSFDVLSNGNFTVIPNANVSIPPNITLTRPNQAQNATIRFTSSFNFTTTTPSTPFVPLQGLGREQLFLTSPSGNSTSPNLPPVLSAIQNNSAISNQLAFLSYESKFLAGGWRFLTYFGRDTLLALRLLLPVISPTSAEAILGAVISRTNETGTICHEETIGDYASYVNLQENRSSAGNTPVYNYVMVDTDFLLLPVLAEYFLSTPQGQGRAQTFLSQTSTLKNGTFAFLLQENVDHVLNLSRPFAEGPQAANLVQIRDPVVGNWRDSAAGLGYGKYPFDVNCALVPAALRAIARLAGAGIIGSNYSTLATTYAGVWEREASQYFRVSISPTVAQARLDDYVSKSNLSSSLLVGAGALNGSTAVGSQNGTAGRGWSASGQTIGVGGNSTMYGVSLNANGSVVEILNSDLAFVLLYANNVSQSIMQATVEALQPYPRGLLTNVGMVVANAAYDSNRTNTQVFSNLAYHGAVSWSWQQGLMASGLSRQLGLCGLSNSTQLSPSSSSNSTNATAIDTIPSWCANTTFTSTVLAAQSRLWDSIAGSASALYTEVLSPVFNNQTGRFDIGNLGELAPEGTEGDAIQLWSYGFLAQVDPRTGRAVAGGF